MSGASTDSARPSRFVRFGARIAGVVYLLCGLPGVIFFLRALAYAREMRWDAAGEVAVASLVLCICPTMALAGVGLLLLKEWGRVLAVAVFGLSLNLALVAVFLDGTYQSAILIPVIALFFGVSLFATSRPSLAAATGAKSTSVGAFARFVLFGVVGLTSWRQRGGDPVDT